MPDASELEFEVETLYEEKETSSEPDQETSLVSVKGIGKGTAEGLAALGVSSIDDLLEADPEDLSAKLSGASATKVIEWQKNAKQLKV